MASVRTLIHIGLPRTASTFLQRQVFPKIQGFNFFGVNTAFYSEPFQKLLYSDESLYKHQSRDQLIRSESENIFLSNELFCGQSFGMNATNRTRTALRLKQSFPGAEIVLVLRNQLSLLESLYAIGVYSGIHKKPEDFLVFEDKVPRYDTFSANEHIETYKLAPLLKLYKEHFSKVHIFLFEDFRTNPELFLKNLANTLGVNLDGDIPFRERENRSLSKRQISYFRKINRAKPILEWNKIGKSVFRQKLWFGEHVLGGKKRFHFSNTLSERIREYFKEDNLELAKAIPNLGKSENFVKYYNY